MNETMPQVIHTQTMIKVEKTIFSINTQIWKVRKRWTESHDDHTWESFFAFPKTNELSFSLTRPDDPDELPLCFCFLIFLSFPCMLKVPTLKTSSLFQNHQLVFFYGNWQSSPIRVLLSPNSMSPPSKKFFLNFKKNHLCLSPKESHIFQKLLYPFLTL